MAPRKQLRGRAPRTIQPGKPKILVSGRPGVGKTWTTLEFPSVYFIDTEGGAELSHYQCRLKENNAAYLGRRDGSQDFKTVIGEVQMLATTRHPYKTLVIDSLTKLWNIEAGMAEEKFGSDFGRDKKEANKPLRQLLRWLDRLDMTVILICHERDKWLNGECIGQTFDCYEKLEYELHLWLQIQQRGKDNRTAIVRKSRLEGFPTETSFVWSYPEFAQRYGRELLEADSVAIELASPAQVEELTKLLEVVKVEEDTISAWKAKAEVEDWVDMPSETIQKCIDWLRQTLLEMTGDSTIRKVA